MSRIIVEALKGPIDRAFGLLAEFIKVCPDDAWAETGGGWPVWQEIYHALVAVNLFADVEGEKPAPLAEADVCSLRAVAGLTVGRDQVQAAWVAAKDRVDRYLAALTDDDLPKRNETTFRAINMDLSHAAVLSLLSGHTLYHLGAGDSALRRRGLKGVF